MKRALLLSAVLLLLAGGAKAQAPGSAQWKGTPHGTFSTWTPGTGCVTFNVYRSTTSGGPYIKLNTAPVTVPQYEDLAGGLTTNTTYFYVVTCLDATGANESAYSNESSVVTPATFPVTPSQPSGMATKNN